MAAESGRLAVTGSVMDGRSSTTENLLYGKDPFYTRDGVHLSLKKGVKASQIPLNDNLAFCRILTRRGNRGGIKQRHASQHTTNNLHISLRWVLEGGARVQCASNSSLSMKMDCQMGEACVEIFINALSWHG